MLKQSLAHLFDTFGMTAPDSRLFGDDIGGLYDYFDVCLEVLCLGSWLWGSSVRRKPRRFLRKASAR